MACGYLGGIQRKDGQTRSDGRFPNKGDKSRREFLSRR